MISTPEKTKEVEALTKIDEYKSNEGIRFRAKLMGNTVVDDSRGKTVAEYAMAKLKLNIMKQKQHKTRVNIALKWEGFFVYLSDGGQELLHFFPLENISFVWKDPHDNRAFGIIRTEGSTEKQTLVTRFFGYKTEKPALPLIMALKELFGLRANEQLESNDSVDVTDNERNTKEDLPHATEDLLDLKVDLTKSPNTDIVMSESADLNSPSNWTSFSNVNLFSSYPPATTFQPGISMANTMPAHWQQYPSISEVPPAHIWSAPVLQQYSNPFSPPILYHSPTARFNTNVLNPFESAPTNVTVSSVPVSQPPPMKSTQLKISKNHVNDLFSDLLSQDYCLEPSLVHKQHAGNSLPNDGNNTAKVSLMEMKHRQEMKEAMDFSIFDKGTVGKVNTTGQKADTASVAIPLFQFD